MVKNLMPKGKTKIGPIRSRRVHLFGSTVIGCHPDDFISHISGKDLTIIRRATSRGIWRVHPFYIYIAPDSPITYYTSYKGDELRGVHADIEAEGLTSTYGRYFKIYLLNDLSKTRTVNPATTGVYSKTSVPTIGRVYLLGPVVVQVEPEDFIGLTTGSDLPIICKIYNKGWKRFHSYTYAAPDTPITYYTKSRVELPEVRITYETQEMILPRGLY